MAAVRGKQTVLAAGIAVAGIWAASSALAEQAPADLTYYTEELPPLNYKTEDGDLGGIIIDVWEELWSRMGADLDRSVIRLRPWARGLYHVKETPGTALAATAYTEDRAQEMAFVGPVMEQNIALIAPKAADIELDTVEDAAAYDVTTVREDIGEELVVAAGLDRDSLDRVRQPGPAARKLATGRADLWAYTDSVAFFEMQRQGMDPDAYEIVHVLKTVEVHLAFHESTDPELLASFQNHLDAMRADGTLAAILADYPGR